MKRRCGWAGCPLPSTQTVGYWGEWRDLCDEHAEMVGDDGSMDIEPEAVTT